MKPGRYKAIALDKQITENSKGNPQVVIQLEVELSETEKKTMNYYGQLVGGAVEHTLKALVACGITGNDLTAPITKGTEVSVTIDADIDKDGKEIFKIAWVNKPMGMGEPMDPSKAKAALAKYTGALARLRQGQPISEPNKKTQSQQPPKIDWPPDDEDPPF